ncbi:MAG TPA: response regulator, partial [Tahibacter sp.]|nr:response regulator [Tahibacter sp.]
MSSTILVVDDEARFREILALALQRAGHRVVTAEDGRAALALLESERVDVVMTDLRMPQMDGRSLLATMKQRWADIPVVVVTAYASLKDAVSLIKEGAFDYVSKPFEMEELQRVIHNALALHRALDENTRLKGELGARYGLERLIGNSAAHQRLVEAVGDVAQNRANVLLTGESGTGKELTAVAIHERSARRNAPFVPINCGAIPPHLLQSELFGYERGAFTGA